MNKKRERTIMMALLVLPIVIAILMNAGLARAQGNRDADRAQEALIKTDEVIAQAKSVISETRSQKGRVSLDVAVAIQERAWGDYRLMRYLTAGKLTLQAREEAWHAVALARGDAQGEVSLARITDETVDRITRLRDMIAESGIRDEQSLKLIEEARMLLDKSRVNAQQTRYQLALKLAGNARQVTLRAEERVRNVRTLKEMTERRLALLERLVERARDRVQETGDNRARDELLRAERNLEKARELINEGRYREARHALDACEKMLRSSVRLVPPPAANDPAQLLDGARRLLARADEIIAEQGGQADPKTVETLEQARAMIGRAEDALAAGRPDEARATVARVVEMLRACLRTEASELTRERVMQRIERVAALGDETRNLAASCPAPGIRELMERAEEHLRLAREHAEASRLDSAEAEATIARNLFQRISDICAR
jgi:HEPN domain-containing protein